MWYDSTITSCIRLNITGRLALKLVDKKGLSMEKAAVMALVYTTILWAVEPLQSCAEGHKIGRRVGQQSGDVTNMLTNWHFSIFTTYFAGESLDSVRMSIEDYIMTVRSQDNHVFQGQSILLYHQARVLKEGMCAFDKTSSNILTEAEAQQKLSNTLFHSVFKIHQLVRAYLFRKHLDIVDVSISDDIERNKHPLRTGM